MLEFKSLADVVRDQRSRKKMSLSLLSACVGLSSGYLSDVERGVRLPVKPTDKLLRLCDALDISQWQLACCLVYNHALRAVGKDLSFALHKVYDNKFSKFLRAFMQYLVSIQVLAGMEYEIGAEAHALRMFSVRDPRLVSAGAVRGGSCLSPPTM